MQTVPAHFLTSLVLIGGSLVVPLLSFGTYYFSGAGLRKALAISAGVSVWGLAVFLFAWQWQFSLASPGIVWVFIAANFVAPSVVVVIFRDYFVGDGLSLGWLKLPQAFRFMGLLFILENAFGYTGTLFAFTAGFGDLMAAVMATTLLVQLIAGDKPGPFIFYALVVFGTVDFLVAYTLSFLSTDGTLFHSLAQGETHLMALLPLALLPYFLVPFAMAYHTMMVLTLRANRGRIGAN